MVEPMKSNTNSAGYDILSLSHPDSGAYGNINRKEELEHTFQGKKKVRSHPVRAIK